MFALFLCLGGFRRSGFIRLRLLTERLRIPNHLRALEIARFGMSLHLFGRYCVLDLRDEPVAEGRDCLDIGWSTRVVTQLLAKNGDGAGERALLDKSGRPDGLQNEILLQKLARVLNEEQQDSQRPRLERDSLALPAQAEVEIVKFELMEDINQNETSAMRRIVRPSRNLGRSS